MARKGEAEQLLRQGKYPSQIAAEMQVSVATVIQYLRTRVGEGGLRLSDIYFSFPREQRQIMQDISARSGRLDVAELRQHGLSREECDLFTSLRTRRVFAGDMYELVADTEVALHGWVRATLEAEYGTDDEKWWDRGIPPSIADACLKRRSDDPHPVDSPFAYTTLLQLFKIVEKNWSFFEPLLPPPYASNKTLLERDFQRLNSIRNAVMHPVKGRKWTEDDFEYVRRLLGMTNLLVPYRF